MPSTLDPLTRLLSIMEGELKMLPQNDDETVFGQMEITGLFE